MTIILRNHPDHDYYEEYGFLNYLAVVLNAVSAELVVETHVDGSVYRLKCARGAVVEPLRLVGPSGESGTRILFRADPEVFANHRLDVETVKHGLQQLAKDYPQVRFVLREGNGNPVEVKGAGA
jgi:DNA gyrase subunit B